MLMCMLLLMVMSLSMLCNAYHEPGFGVSFHEGMSNFEWYRALWTKTDPGWKLAYDLYTHYIITDLQYQKDPRIPKIIHQIWIGSQLPEKYIPLILSWQKHHPDWVYILWTDDDIAQLNLVNQDQYDASTNYGQKADIARYEILYRFGGVYIDIDFECLRPLDVFHHCCDYYTGIGYAGRFSTFNGLIGAAPENVIIKACIDTLDINAYYEGSEEHNILFTSGPFHQARCFLAHAHEAGRAVAFPVNYFYPWPFSKKEDVKNIEKWFKSETYAVHYWHCGWRESGQSKLWSLDECKHLCGISRHCLSYISLPYFIPCLLASVLHAWQTIVNCFKNNI